MFKVSERKAASAAMIGLLRFRKETRDSLIAAYEWVWPALRGNLVSPTHAMCFYKRGRSLKSGEVMPFAVNGPSM